MISTSHFRIDKPKLSGSHRFVSRIAQPSIVRTTRILPKSQIARNETMPVLFSAFHDATNLSSVMLTFSEAEIVPAGDKTITDKNQTVARCEHFPIPQVNREFRTLNKSRSGSNSDLASSSFEFFQRKILDRHLTSVMRRYGILQKICGDSFRVTVVVTARNDKRNTVAARSLGADRC